MINKNLRSLQKHTKIISSICLLILTSTLLHAQDYQLDSVNQLITKAKADSDRIKLNIDKIILLARSDLNAAITLGKSQLEEAEKINYYKGIVKLRSQLSNNFIFTGEYEKALENIHFLEKYIKPKDSFSYSDIISTYGMMYGVRGIYDSSILYYVKTIELNERLHNDIELSGNYTNISIGYQQLANYPMALKYQQKALTLAQKNGNVSQEARTLLNMAITYQNIGDTDRAVKMYLSSVDKGKKANSRIVELYGYTNLATLYLAKQEYSKAYDLAIKAADLAAISGDKGIQAASLSKAATSLAYQHQFEEGAELAKKAIVMADSSTQPLNISQAYNAMAMVLFLQKNYKEAKPFFEKTLQVLPDATVYDMALGDAYKFLSICYEKTGQYQKALTSYQKGVNIADSMRRKDNIRKATELSMNYDFQKKQEIQNAEQKLKDRIAHSRLIVVLVGLGIFLLLSVLAFIGYKNKQKANALLKKQKQQIETTLGQLKSAQAQLIQSEKMASLGQLTAGIAHEIQNPLNFVNNFSEVSTELIDEMKDELAKGNGPLANEIADDLKQNLVKISHHGKRAGEIVKGMLQHSRASSGKKEPTNINALCDEYLRLAYQGLSAKDKTFNAVPIAIGKKTDFNQGIGKINIVPQDIGRVLLNLINNAFYAVAERNKDLTGFKDLLGLEAYNPTVSVQTKKIKDKPGSNRVEITIKDNGNGIPKNIVDKIFQPFFTTKPTGQGTGLGLSLSYDIVKAHGGEIKVKTHSSESSFQIGEEEEGGTEFIVVLPITE